MPRLLNIVILLLFAVGKCYTFFRRALFFVSEKSDGKVRTIRRKSLRLFGIPESPESLFGNTIGHVNAALSRRESDSWIPARQRPTATSSHLTRQNSFVIRRNVNHY
jgi:hypothetical protein